MPNPAVIRLDPDHRTYMVRPAMQEEPDVRQKEKLRPYIRHRVEGPLPTLVP
jgi:hypothetical protein